MLKTTPTPAMLEELLGPAPYAAWQALCQAIEERYDMDRLWDSGGKSWTYEYKYRRGGKTLCSLYAKSQCMGFLVIFGKAERAKVEAIWESLSPAVRAQYEAAQTYHDGKWVMFQPAGTADFDGYLKLLALKRRPNRK